MDVIGQPGAGTRRTRARWWARRRPAELRPVDDALGAAGRIPWVEVTELVATLGALLLILVVLVRLTRVTGNVDLVAVGAGTAALVMLTTLLLRQRRALTRASRHAAAEAERARSDHLTGLPNRLAVEAELDALLHRGQGLMHKALVGRGTKRRVIPFWAGAAYLAIDLDEFKPVNDSAGHAEGDRLLQEIAEILKAACGPTDLPGRVGGDEFVILMKERDHARARELACTVRDALAAHHFAVEGRRYPVSGSLGLVRIAPGNNDADAVRAAADRGSYAAKENGRDALFELATLDADPVLIERSTRVTERRARPQEAEHDDLPNVLAYRFISLAAGQRDALDLRLDPRREPPVTGHAHRHLLALSEAVTLVDASIAVSIVFPPIVGAEDLAAFETAARRIARPRAANTTLLLQPPRRHADHDWLPRTVQAARAVGLRVGIVCNQHSLAGIGVLAPLDIDEVQLHLARAPKGTLGAYTLLARACEWSISVADVEDASELKRLANGGVSRAGGRAIGPPGLPANVLPTLGQPLRRETRGAATQARRTA